MVVMIWALKKMNPTTVRIFDINEHMVVTQFSKMCSSSWSDADGNFVATYRDFSSNEIPWEKYISLGVDNTSVNIGKHHSLITKAREKNDKIILIGCPCNKSIRTKHKLQFRGTAC